ncbi:MAG: hypothetical protein LBD84_03780 [Campylobacteraceae bacterium]|nr:hypothetical protein [Campylobacteraceae bacterium]
MGNLSRIDAQKEKLETKHYQNGLKERLLCKECNNEVGILGNYAGKVLFRVIPKTGFKIFSDVGKTYLLQLANFDYDKLRKFFVSLVWRVSVCKSEPFSLGKYEGIALKILKNEIPDDENLFLPLVYRKKTNTNVDYITCVFQCKFFGKHICYFRFPNYEIIIFINTQNSNDDVMMNVYKKMFNKKEIILIYPNMGYKKLFKEINKEACII